MLSLRIWKAIDTAKWRLANLVGSDEGAGEFVAVIILILIIIAIGLLFNGDFVNAIKAQITRIIDGINNKVAPGV